MKGILFLFLLFTYSCYSQQLKTIAPQTDASFRGLSVVDDSTVWVSGNKGWIGISTDGANTWNFMRVKGFENYDFRTLYAFDANKAVIANAGTPAYILYTENAGNNWQQVYKNEDSAAFFDGIDFWNAKEGVIYGDPIDGRMLLLRTNDGGKSWEEFSVSERPALKEGEASFAASGSCIHCLDDDKLAIATGGSISRLWISENKGKDWTTITTPILQGESTRGIFSFAYGGRKNAVIVGGDYKIDTLTTANVFYTKNGGKKWIRPIVPTRGYRESVTYINKKTLLATGPTGTDISRDCGKKWQPFSDEKQYHAIRKARKGNLIIMTGGSGKIAILTK